MSLAGWPCGRCSGPLAADGGCPRCAAGPSLPWEDLAAAGERLEAARRRRELAGPDTPEGAAAELDELEAGQALGEARRRCGYFLAHLVAAARTDPRVAAVLADQLCQLRLADDDARAMAMDAADCIQLLADELLATQHALKDLRRELDALRREQEAVLYDRDHADAEVGADLPGPLAAVRPADEWGYPRVVG